jgi:hypothetical protein
MKVLRSLCTLVVVCGVLAVFSAATAKADQLSGSDPRVALGGDPPSAPAGIITTSFSIVSPSGTSPATSPCVLMQGGISTSSPNCLFENDISVSGVGETIYSLTLDAVGVAPSTATCGFLTASPLKDCGVDPLPSGNGTQFSFDVGSIPFHNDFTLSFTGFPSNFDFAVQAGTTSTTVPEPGTLALLLTGMGLATLRIRRQIRAS